MASFWDMTVEERIAELHPNLEDLNHYQLLHIDRQADANDIKKAYRKFVQLMHPDRHASEVNEEDRKKLEQIFNEVNSAYSVLSDPEKRAKYDQNLLMAESRGVKQTKAGSDEHTAERQYRSGMDELKKKEIARAIEFFRSAVQLNPNNPEYWAKLALAQMSHPRMLKEAQENCRRALKMNRENANYHALMGRILQKNNDPQGAEQSYRFALSWDPNHRLARQQLTIIRAQLRAENPTWKDRILNLFSRKKAKPKPEPEKPKGRRPPRPPSKKIQPDEEDAELM